MAQEVSTLQGAPRKSKSRTPASVSRPPVPEEDARNLRWESAGILLWMLSLLLFLALVSFDPTGESGNWVGRAGRWSAHLTWAVFGLVGWVLVPMGLAFGYRVIRVDLEAQAVALRSLGVLLAVVGNCALLDLLLPVATLHGMPVGGGLGVLVADGLRSIFGSLGGGVVALTVMALGWIVLTGRSVVEVGESAVRLSASLAAGGARASLRSLRTWNDARRARSAERRQLALERRAAEHEALPEPESVALDPDLGDATEAAAPKTSGLQVVVDSVRTRLRRTLGLRRASAAHSEPATQEDPAWVDAPGLDAEPVDAIGEDWFFDEQPPAHAEVTLEPVVIPARAADEPAPHGRAPAVTADRLEIDTDSIVSERPADGPIADWEAEIPVYAETIRIPRAAASLPETPASPLAPAPREADAARPAQESLRASERLAREARVDLFADDDDADEPEALPDSPAPSSTRASAPRSTREDATEASDESPSPGASTKDASSGPVIVRSERGRPRLSSADLDRVAPIRRDEERAWEFPPLSFLGYRPSDDLTDAEFLRAQATQLETVFASFRIQGRVTNICPGPVVTRYEYEPEQGTKLAKISNLTDDVAMALKARSIRIIAPIPGKGCVGIEVPNEHRETVYLKEMLADPSFTRQAGKKLTVALGKDIEGAPVVANLEKMPHLLVAGTTGSGKSVSVNAMITSLLYNASPDDVRMIMIDPKQLEFAVYEGVPHLLLPVVTDPQRAAAALDWAVQEMERRYRLMAELRVRNINGYNEKLRELHADYDAEPGEIDERTFAEKYEVITRTEDDGRPEHRHMHYIVVIVDEFADLMMVAGKEVEQAVARLAQKARAAGIHVILATQRPSVDVLTGLIKSNFPTRMSFRLMSGIDSRTVLDTQGAENLLGQGDMLYRAPGQSELTRIHGAYVDEREIEKIVDFLKAQREPEYDESILLGASRSSDAADDGEVDERYRDALAIVIERGSASVSMIQRELTIGYNKAAKIVEQMERDGYVGPQPSGAKRREVFITSLDSL